MAPDPPQFSEHGNASIDEVSVSYSFPAWNPCTNEGHLVTAEGTVWFQPHPNNRTVRWKFALTTTDGYAGTETGTWTGSDWNDGPGQMSIRTLNVRLVNSEGSRFMVHLVWVIDTENGTWNMLVDRVSATCVIP